jgi:hypothetical protein
MGGYAEPYALEMAEATLAAVMEMADRARAGNWEPNLGEPSAAPAPPAPRALSALRVAPMPCALAATATIRWEGVDGPGEIALRLFDAAGRQCRESGPLPGRSGTWSPGRLAAGVYRLEARSGSGRVASCPVVIVGP